jgi:predicted membrane-bound spermidine synthase
VAVTALLGFPAGLCLSLLTPLAVRLGTADVRIAGRIAGMTFALGTLGCLAGNYLTGFWLIPSLTINAIVLAVALGLLALAVVPYAMAEPKSSATKAVTGALPDLRPSYAVVFLCSFAGMALELAGVRLMAQIVGVSLFTWTGVIGVMLAGTCTGNWLGGVLADRAHRRGTGRSTLAACLIFAGVGSAAIIVTFIASQGTLFREWGIVAKTVGWSFALFLLPMAMLGTISPQVIRLATVDAGQAGTIAGRVYAVSTIGAIVGTFATGYWLVGELGMFRVVLLTAIIPIGLAVAVGRIWNDRLLLYVATLVGGIAAGGMALFTPSNTGVARESNYFTIQVKPVVKDPILARQGVLTLQLDLLVHSWVKPTDPTFLHYAHEQIQLNVLRDFATKTSVPKTLVIGGGGYTFPRAAKTVLPGCVMDVVEIDPAVTEVSYERLFLDPKLGINAFHMDGRQFVEERAVPGSYQLVTMDAVNDLSVPGHLLTAEFNDRVKRILAPDGVYLVTVIDQPDIGKIWKAASHTLKGTFRHVQLLSPSPTWKPDMQAIYVLYASDVPFDGERLRSNAEAAMLAPRVAAFGGVAGSAAPWTFANLCPQAEIDKLLATDSPIKLTDQYAPVDWLMAEVFRRRQFAVGK